MPTHLQPSHLGVRMPHKPTRARHTHQPEGGGESLEKLKKVLEVYEVYLSKHKYLAGVPARVRLVQATS